MTREQAITHFIDEDACCQGRVDVPRLINRIYDDFESRVCENCKYYQKRELFIEAYCKHEESIGAGLGTIGDGWLPEDFGCNRFERKEDERKEDD